MKATHSGTCQACGSFQKLPGGVLAKHGYTVAWGFFSGVCAGSRHLPFEVSTDFIATMIQGTKNSIAGTEEEIAELKASTSNKVWMNVYRSGSWAKGDKGGYVWHQVELVMETKTFSGGGTYVVFSYVNAEGKTIKVDAYKGNGGHSLSAETMAEAVAYFNGRRIATLQARVNDMQNYIAWQEKRVAEWKPGTLTEVK